MEIKESYRMLELEVGATREAVEAAYCRLLERWHPDRTASGGGGPEAVREAQRMVQAINEAYQTLVKIAPAAATPSTSLPANAPPSARAKPVLPPWNAAQQASARQPTPPPTNSASPGVSPRPGAGETPPAHARTDHPVAGRQRAGSCARRKSRGARARISNRATHVVFRPPQQGCANI